MNRVILTSFKVTGFVLLAICFALLVQIVILESLSLIASVGWHGLTSVGWNG